ncbi:MAG: 30S ribosomal protein S12 methylthiotransferase RimO, partial [Candidatus Dadabacteria bacterium]|nr:30S ribosomal protein S12 methylthiotransferase RimO [Candidatus Dadabacteria bacterium]NIS10339.1 30S ribosomal protein S12 methylthiotransferase RimO [Candidatus Dadabacteria bacterium]NIY23248.1 30S ribosomal protein S12 methylthiotransferase RimO [Candidatus Dadabacteria bacterium]
EITSEENADVIVINTCGFIGDAKKESINTILDLAEYKKSGSCKKLIVTGCLVERYSEQLKDEFPEVDHFWGTGNLLKINEVLSDTVYNFNKTPYGTIYDPDSPRVRLMDSHTSFVKVSEGCSRTCSFCIIPKMRGIMKSRTVDSIYNEVYNLGENGVKEVNLIAQDMTSYGRDIGTSLETLLEELKTVDSVNWIRLHYCYPWGFSDELVALLAGDNNLLPYIDMPIQHINDRILKLMERKTPKSRILSIIKKLKQAMPDLTLRTTFIVGFPSETEEEFEELVDFVEETKFQRAGAFRYSHEEGTPSYDIDGQVDEDIKEERLERLLNIQSDISLENNRRLIGKTFGYFVEGTEDGDYFGRINTQAPEVDGLTYITTDKKLQKGDYLQVRVTEADIYNLHAELI